MVAAFQVTCTVVPDALAAGLCGALNAATLALDVPAPLATKYASAPPAATEIARTSAKPGAPRRWRPRLRGRRVAAWPRGPGGAARAPAGRRLPNAGGLGAG